MVLQYFRCDDVFYGRIKGWTDEEKQLFERLALAINRLGFDWYFTKIEGDTRLRFGRKELESQKASEAIGFVGRSPRIDWKMRANKYKGWTDITAEIVSAFEPNLVPGGLQDVPELDRPAHWPNQYILYSNDPPEYLRQLNYERQLTDLTSLSDEALMARIESTTIVPARYNGRTTIYDRNPAIVVHALRRANGTCQQCHKPAPFNRISDGTPYLEVHHLKRLAEGGLDTIENTLAICPNCHRKLHYGV